MMYSDPVYSDMGRDVGMVGRDVAGAGLGLVRIMAILFFLAVLISSILIIWEGLNLKPELKDGKDIDGRADRIYTYSIILAVALGLNVLTLLWDWSTSSM
jgi:hypothetical protein